MWEGGSLKGGRGSLTAGETDGARFSQSPPNARLSQSSLPRAGSGSWGRPAGGDDPPASGTGAAGVGAEPRAARGQVANWIRECGGESHGRAGEPGGGARAAGAAERGSCPTAAAQPSSTAGREEASWRSRRLPRRKICSLKPLFCPRPHPERTGAGSGPSFRRGVEPGPSAGERACAETPGGRRGWAGLARGGASGGGGHPGPPWREPAPDSGVEAGYGGRDDPSVPLTLCSLLFPPAGRPQAPC